MKNINDIIRKTETNVLISTLTTIFHDMSKMSLNVMIQEELETRIGVNKLDNILDGIR